MYISDQDRITPAPASRSPVVMIAVVFMIIAAGAGAYFYLSSLRPVVIEPVPVVQAPVPVDLPLSQPAPQSIVPPKPPAVIMASEPAVVAAPSDPPLPPVDESDATVKAEVTNLLPESMRAQLADNWAGSQLLRRFVVYVANIAQGKIDAKSSPVLPPKGRFSVDKSGRMVMTKESHARYTPYVEILTSIDPAECAALYRRFYPLLHGAYAELGEKNMRFHSVMVSALDVVLNTPDLIDEPELQQEKVMYTYVDPQLEKLPAAQKQLLRMGDENVRRVKDWVQQFQAQLLTKEVGNP